MSAVVPGSRPASSLPHDIAFEFGAASHPGVVRSVNEDGWLAAPPVFLVADGMGGHRAGDVASAIVVSSFDSLVRSGAVGVSDVERCIADVRRELEALGAGSAVGAPGSTLVAAVHVVEQGIGYWLVVNIGDSRIYSWSEGRFEQLSHDHSLVQELIDAGELEPSLAAGHPERNVVTRALGAVRGAPVDYSLIPAAELGTLLLCSDGITAELDDSAVARIMGRHAHDPREAAEMLVGAAVEAGGRDNATAVVVRLDATAAYVETLGGPDTEPETTGSAG
ncbi:serine/threonine-protein phosphatase [Nocardioides sp. J2M5]|uniref:PP2C family protein-serine/threonine phosphatase n=1 Tax=Nocardioides palaemonis TaxID=2829810 RepID=UPI001BACDDFA|nr:protein phosphatase 2C domain-containing protein [Nocardioides palaemonis]MBS2939462.1 serine/threonine-protein phosphatase [Nocardioides palaemonis]